MKHLRRFNEELNPMTYRRAASKLDKIEKESPKKGKAIDAKRRSDDLRQHAKEIESKEHYRKWKKEIETFKEFGEFEFILEEGGNPETFYISLISELDSLTECWNDGEQDSINFSFAGGIIPMNDEQYSRLTKLYDAYNGFIWAFWIMVDYDIKNEEIKFKGISMDTYEIEDLQIANRKTANNLKKLLVDIFDNKFYPSGYTDIDNAHDRIQKEIIQGLSLSIDYGFEMDNVKSDISKSKYTDFFITQ